MKLTVDFGRDEIIQAFRDDNETDERELYNQFSEDDKLEMLFKLCPDRDCMTKIIELLQETDELFDSEGMEEIASVWRTWLEAKKISIPLKKFKVLRLEAYSIYVEAKDAEEAERLPRSLRAFTKDDL